MGALRRRNQTINMHTVWFELEIGGRAPKVSDITKLTICNTLLREGKSKTKTKLKIHTNITQTVNGTREREGKKIPSYIFLVVRFCRLLFIFISSSLHCETEKKNEYAKQQPATPFSAKINK